MQNDIVTVLTAPGVAAIAVVRLAGPGVDNFLARHFSKSVPAGRCVYGLLKDGDRTIDDALVVRIGDGVDLNLHGGTWVVQSVLQLAQADGFELSDAFTVDGESEIWREVLRALPKAKTEEAVRMLLAQPAAWETSGDLQKIIGDRSGYWMLATPRLAIVGPANVGKSTLANQLFGQVRSITADLPGTTRDWVGEIANIDGLAVMLVDTPGQRVTDDPIEGAAISSSKLQIDSADVVILVLDQALPLDRELLDRYPTAIRVANKSDTSHLWEADEIDAIKTIAIDGAGIDQLRAAIRRRFGCEPIDITRPRWWTKQQRGHLKRNGNLTKTS